MPNRLSPFFALGLVSVIFTLASACASMEARARGAKLDEAIDHYTEAVRWGDYETALSYHLPRAGRVPPADSEALENFRVTSIEVKSTRLHESMLEALIDLGVEYYSRFEGVVRSLRARQVWYYDERLGTWFIDGPFLALG
jgi:hypothetical protein